MRDTDTHACKLITATHPVAALRAVNSFYSFAVIHKLAQGVGKVLPSVKDLKPVDLMDFCCFNDSLTPRHFTSNRRMALCIEHG